MVSNINFVALCGIIKKSSPNRQNTFFRELLNVVVLIIKKKKKNQEFKLSLLSFKFLLPDMVCTRNLTPSTRRYSNFAKANVVHIRKN